MKMFFIIIVLCTTVLSYSHCFQIHDELTDEEVLSIFKVSRDFIPEYDVVPIAHTFHKTFLIPEIRLQAFDNLIKLHLKPNNHLLIGKDTPVYLSYKDKTKASGIRYTKIDHDVNFEVFHDNENKNVIMISKEIDDNIEIYGTIRNDMIIRPLPSHIQEKLYKPYFHDNKYLFESNYSNGNYNYNENSRWIRSAEDDEYRLAHHIVMKIPKEQNKSDYKLLNETFEKSFIINIINWMRGLTVNIVYPEILVSSDYNTFLAHGSNVNEFIKYMAIFWNGVDLRYKSVKQPRVQLHIAGIIIPQEYSAVPYVESAKLFNNKVWAQKGLNETAEFFYVENYFPKNNFDIVVVITKQDLVAVSNEKLVSGVTGLAFFSHACMRIPELKKFTSIAIVEDNAKFGGVLTTAHEIGHLLGASHDGDKSPVPFIPGGENCPFADGYLMSYVINENSFKWSTCTLKSFETYLSHPWTKCLRNKPHVKYPYPKILPGRVATLKEQCEARFPGTIPCQVGPSVCRILFCGNEKMENCIAVQGAVEGSSCAYGNGICLDGRCVSYRKRLQNDTQNVMYKKY